MTPDLPHAIAGFDMGFATVAGHAPVSTIKFSLGDASECFLVLPRPAAALLIQRLLAFAEKRLAGAVDAEAFERQIEDVERAVVRARPTMTPEEATDPPLATYVASFDVELRDDCLAVHLVFGDGRRQTLTIDAWRALILIGYMHNVIEVADQDAISPPQGARH
jgi:hypothetical protein